MTAGEFPGKCGLEESIMSVPDYQVEKARFISYYDSNLFGLRQGLSSVQGLVALLLTSSNEFFAPTVSGRVKDRDECLKKFERKYQRKCEVDGVDYKITDYISDLLGIRAVCLYEKDVFRIRELIRDNFEVIEETDKTAAMEMSDATFGYKGLHMDLRLSARRLELPEYKRMADLRFELQIRTTVQNAWSVLDHKIKYKKSIPYQLKRSINRLAALFELADKEFVRIQEETEKLEMAEVGGSAGAYQPEGEKSEDKKLDAFSFLAIARKTFPDWKFIGVHVDGFVAEIGACDPNLSAAEFAKMVEDELPIVLKYKGFTEEEKNTKLNPFTVMRHILFLHDSVKYADSLFDFQRTNFERWLASREGAVGQVQDEQV